MKVWDRSLLHVQEQVVVMYLNSANVVIAWRCFNTGSGAETLFDIKFVLSCAMGCLAAKIVVAHNHPNGILRPSRSDLDITERMRIGCGYLDIRLEDHLIVGHPGFYSFADNGLLR